MYTKIGILYIIIDTPWKKSSNNYVYLKKLDTVTKLCYTGAILNLGDDMSNFDRKTRQSDNVGCVMAVLALLTFGLPMIGVDGLGQWIHALGRTFDGGGQVVNVAYDVSFWQRLIETFATLLGGG